MIALCLARKGPAMPPSKSGAHQMLNPIMVTQGHLGYSRVAGQVPKVTLSKKKFSVRRSHIYKTPYSHGIFKNGFF